MRKVPTIWTPKKILQKQKEDLQGVLRTDSRGGEHSCSRLLCFYCKEPHRTGDKNTCGEYKKEASILNMMRTEICDSYKAKEILGYRRGKSYVSSARGAAKREENQIGTTVETIPQSRS